MRRKLQDRIVTRGRQRVLRKRLMPYEPAASLAVLLLLLFTGVLVARQRNRFDPRQRGIGIDFSRKRQVKLSVGAGLQSSRARSGSPTEAPLDLPRDVVPSGFAVRSAKTFGPETLYEKVDGQAEQFLKFDFRNLSFVAMVKGDASIDLYLYDQGIARNAIGLFAEMRAAGEAIAADGPMHYVATEAGSYGILGRFFFQIIGSGASAWSLEDTRRGLLGLETDPEGEAAPLRRFEAMGVPFERISYEPADVFQLDFARDFWFAALDAEGTERIFFHEAAAPDAAETLLQRLVEASREEYDPVGESSGSFVLRHRFLKSYLVMTTRGSVLLGVEGSKDEQEAMAALTKLAESLDDD